MKVFAKLEKYMSPLKWGSTLWVEFRRFHYVSHLKEFVSLKFENREKFMAYWQICPPWGNGKPQFSHRNIEKPIRLFVMPNSKWSPGNN